MSVTRLMVVPIVLVSLGVAPATGNAQDADVRAAMTETLAAWSAGDFDRLAEFYTADTRGFLFGGALLVRGFNPAALQAAYEAGFRATFTLRGPDIKVLGDVAIAVAYLDGTLTLPGGEAEAGSWRYSETRVRDGGRWKIAQYHFSKVTMPSR
ncbi:MAG: nuclear transport factor 2 family protein [Gemmatimonadota bacterium]|nr:nuclear transport factor 2 family protein [Gemmatimonadota bacterium]MDH3369403.1 nuclear transport factor 2 family protein [Gemmatimonadota bacterium]MDH3478859.1 nuclear transport factor 2 family protein [Gemmatimonadota bacterium]MDH3571868.1 nuclear transport factor 2 family protein [Gemmatimonadota bacterium]